MPYDSDDITAQEGHPSVVAYRLLQVEKGMENLALKIDGIANNYPTTQMLSVILDPIKNDIRNIEADRRQEALNKSTNRATEEANRKTTSSQLKIALIAAATSPIVSIIVTMIVIGRGK